MASVSGSSSMGPPGTVSLGTSAHTTCLAWETWIWVRSPVTKGEKRLICRMMLSVCSMMKGCMQQPEAPRLM